MPIIYEERTARFEDHCHVEEAEGLFAWVRARMSEAGAFRLDLSRCMHLHTALLQIVMLSPAELVMPAAAPLKVCLSGIGCTEIIQA